MNKTKSGISPQGADSMARKITCKQTVMIHPDTYTQAGRRMVDWGRVMKDILVEDVLSYLRVIQYRSR